MSDDYKAQINNQIKEAVNTWIEDLKGKDQTLLLTKQWNVQYPKGFRAGNNVIPVVTSSKKGKHLVAELNIFLPDNLELDLNAVELVLKNEPFKPQKKTTQRRPTPIDEPLDVLNDIIVSVNQFLQNITVPQASASAPAPVFLQGNSAMTKPQQINIKPSAGLNLTSATVDEFKKELLNSPSLPEWYRTIENSNIKAELATKLAESFVHYQQQTGRKIEPVEFFNIFTEHLKKQNKLHQHCRYKGKPVNLDSNGHCLESFCSKKPYQAVCSQTTLKFGEATL